MCDHDKSEDCMICHLCGECREDLNKYDVCSDCDISICPECESTNIVVDELLYDIPDIPEIYICEDCGYKGEEELFKQWY